MVADTPTFAVNILEDAELVYTGWFETLAEAEAFAEEWTDRVPGAHAEFKSRMHDEDVWQLIQIDTATPENP